MIQYSRELVLKKASETFPNVDLAEVLSILDQYGHDHQSGRERVQIAILKLSGGNVVKLQREVEAAKQDPRDVLLYAEYPAEAKAPWDKVDAVKEAREQDKQQYLRWLYNQE